MISILRLFNMLPKLRRPHVVVMVVLILSSLLVCPMMVQTTLAHDSISNHTTRIETTIPHDRLNIHITSATAEGLALCSIADKIPQLTTYPTFSPTQSWVKTPTCDSYTSTNWCGWKGVTCTSGSVTSIDLSTGFGNLVASNGFGKTALSQLTALTNVASFNMAGNSFTGSIPTTIGAMTSLTYLDLSAQASNQFYGTIPTQFGALTNLLSLQLYSNKLQGTIPAFFGNTLTQLTTLNLASNYFTGTVPAALSNILTLTLTYTTNCLSGTASPTLQTHCLTPTGQPSSQPSRQPTGYRHC